MRVHKSWKGLPGPDHGLRVRAFESLDLRDTPGLCKVVACPNRYFLNILVKALGCKGKKLKLV